MLNLGDRIAGAWFGLAAGDRIGGAVMLALCLGESLLAKQAYDREHVLTKYLKWWREGGDSGLVIVEVFRRVDQKHLLIDEAVLFVHQLLKGATASCLPAQRSLALALSPFLDEKALLQAAYDDARLTHYHPVAGETSQAIVLLLRYIIQGKPVAEAIDACGEHLDSAIFERMRRQTSPRLSRGAYAPDALEAALVFLRENRDFRTSYSAALGFSRLENYVPPLLGMLAGALYGIESIPETSYRHARMQKQLKSITGQFVKLWEV